MLPGTIPIFVNSGRVTSTRWRFVSTNAIAGRYWELQQNASSGLFESGDLSGTNLGAGLGSYPTNWAFRSPGGNLNSYGAGYQANPFTSGSNWLISASAPAGIYLEINFSSPRTIGSVAWKNASGYNRDSTSMSLEYWNGATWVSYATLTNTSFISTPKWRNIAQGSTIAASSS